MRLLPAALLLAACATPEDPPVPGTYDPHPETPGILRDVARIDDDVQFVSPFVPGHRTTMDGRVAVRVQGGPPGTEQTATKLSFFLFAPEKLDTPVIVGPPGPEILAESEPFDVVFPPALAPGVTRLGHHAVCDPTPDLPDVGDRPNPYLCGPDGRHDCYDLTILSSTSPGLSATLWGTPVTVEVENPKTPQARIVDVTLGESVQGFTIPTTTEFMEPAITQDGRLLTGRFGRFPRAWTNPETGETLVRPYDLVYSLLPDDADPCDVTQWTTFHPMSHAPHDPRMKGRYGLAAYPFRDSEGQEIPDGEDLGGTYPWVDREGANVFMTTAHGTMAEKSPDRYPRRCVHAGCEDFRENVDWDRGYAVAGLWTHGRFVVLDGEINHLDWAIGVTPAAHYLVDLYKDASGTPVPVRLGAGRFIDAVRDAGGPYPAGYTHNANILDSIQNLLTHHAATRPVTPRDVVWLMSSGVASAEVAFDDWMDPNALIVSSMVASVTQYVNERGESLSIPHVWNGELRNVDAVLPVQTIIGYDPEGHEEIHLQNAATSLGWKVPPYGRVEAGTGRVEPAALGGMEGRGFWLDGSNRVTYAVPVQDRPIAGRDAYVALFVDVRVDDDVPRDLLRFPDDTRLRLVRAATVQLLAGGEVLHEVELPPGAAWRHLAWRLTDGHRTVDLLVDGVPFDRFEADRAVLELTAGDLVVGRVDDGGHGVRGWIDDLKVLLHVPDPEVACNHAFGTLVRVDDAPAWRTVADRHPDWAHAEIAAAAREASPGRYACFHDYTVDHGAHLGNLPAGTTGLRATIHHPEGLLHAGAPRPDTSANAFCLSCHTAEGEGGLSIAALEARPGVVAEHDPRRQPMQPPRLVFGNIPAGWIPAGPGPGGPAEALQVGPEGALVDRWLLPVAE